MSDRNWEAELAKIDKQLASVSDEQLLAERNAPAVPKGGLTRSTAMDARMGTQGATTTRGATVAPPAASAAAPGGTWRSWLKVSIAVAAAAGLMFWPWPARCGLPLIGFTAATGGVALLGMWSAVGTWRHRLGLAHVASILVTLWGLALGAREVLPRVGYAIPTIERAGQWSCEGLPPLPSPTVPGPTTPAPSAPGTGSPG
jgi:hypothetical protein